MRANKAIIIAAVAVSPAAGQVSCGGTTYAPGSLYFSKECSQTVQSCLKQFAGNASLGNCQDAAGDIFLQQQPSSGDNSDVSTALNAIADECLSSGYATGTWYDDGQWYWIAAEGACYNFTMPATPTDLSTPVQQRLSIHSEDAVSIGWNTYKKIEQACVQYGISPEALWWRECADTTATYPTSRTYSHVVTLSALIPATIYYYKIESTNSSIEQFRSPRLPGDKTPFTFATVIDLGAYGADGYTISSAQTKKDSISSPQVQPELNHTTIYQLAQTINDYEFIAHPGDFAYADNWASVFGLESDPVEAYESILEQFYEQLAPVSSRVPYMVSPGNHDADCSESLNPKTGCPVGQTNFTDFNLRFGRMMPTTFPTSSFDWTAKTNSEKAMALSKPPFWYSFDYGMVHFIMIDTETDFPNAPDQASATAINLDAGPFGFPNQQLDFIKADLASVDRTITPWVILGGHRPWYSTGGSGNICSSCQAAFEEVMYTYGVDLAIFGHVHNAQRFVPVFNNTADPNGMHDPKAPMYIVAGGSGNIEGLAAIGSNVSYNAFAYASDYTYATVSPLDRNNLRVDFIRSSTGETLDSSTLYKSHKEQFVVQ